MDSFDAIRADARELHDKLVAAGVDPLNPVALVDAALRELDLEVAPLPHGDPALKGARALFDEQSGTICCEITENAVEAALLVAHEIGHARSHTGSTSCAAEDIDPSRSTESAPVGLQKVEDYGARERRELQANVFAREFLFPRTLAHRLHVTEAMTATAIAERTGLPKNLVRQQLLDVLLLPAAEEVVAESGPALKGRPDPSQDRAAAHRGAPFQLQAGPGTGKTRTLVTRVLSLLQEGLDPSSILVLTFSNRAAGELSERIAAAAPQHAPKIWIGTFHAFGLDLLRRYHDRLGLAANPPLFDRTDIIEVLEEVLPTLPLSHYRNLWDPAMVLRDVVSAISRAKDELVDARRYAELADAMLERAGDDDERLAAAKCRELGGIYAVYERVLLERGAVDFGDLIMRPALLLESDPTLRVALQLRHRHVLVDEYQDVNRASARLLKAVCGDGTRLWVVGDSRQSIYRFRGASSANMEQFSTDYPGAAADQLVVNYRSTAEVVSAFVSITNRMGASRGMLPLNLPADRGPGPSRAEVRRFEKPSDEVAGIASSVRELESAGVRLRDQAVLCRSNSRMSEVAAALEARGIPVLHLGSLFEREEVRDLLALLSLVIDPLGGGLVRVGALPRYSLSLQDVYLSLRFLREKNLPAPAGVAALPTVPGMSPSGVEGLNRLAADLRGLSIASSAWEVLASYLLDRTDLARLHGDCTSITDRMRALAVWQLMNFVREQSPAGAGLPIQRTLDRVRQLVLLAEERDLRQVPDAALHLDAVRLMTVHGSKGLEFEAVHIPGLTLSSFPSNHRGPRCPPPVGLITGGEGVTVSDDAKRSHDLEEECLFFVALSRARTHLRLYLSRLQESGRSRSPSPYLGWIARGAVVEVPSPTTMPHPGGQLINRRVSIVRSSELNVSDSRLTAYEKCPRRYFYTYVLGFSGTRKATAFTRTHDCLFDLIRWLATARSDGAPTVQEAEAEFDGIWERKGPVDHGFADDYRRLASSLIAELVKSGAGRRFRKAKELAIDLPHGRVVVEPSELAELPDGTVVLRRVRTGSKRGDEYDRLEYALYHLAGLAEYGADSKIEAVHLSDGKVEAVVIGGQKLRNRREKGEALLAGISAGDFPPNVDPVTCPRCPHFFNCAALPPGELTPG